MTRPQSHEVRGLWLERAIDLEQRMNRVLQGFFNVPGRFWVEFDWWILNEMQWSAKVKALRSVIRELESLGYDTAAYAGLTTRLEEVGSRRNTLAHRPITNVHEFAGDQFTVAENGTRILVPTDLGPHLIERRPRSRADSYTPVDLGELLADAAALDELVVPITRLEAEVRGMWPYTEQKGDGPPVDHPGTLRERGHR